MTVTETPESATATPETVTGPPWTVPHEVEQFRYLHLAWNVAKAWTLVADAEPSGDVNVADAARGSFGAPSAADMIPPDDGLPKVLWVGVGVDTKWCLSAEPDLDRPLLIARREVGSETITLIIDGYHRLWRAWHDGVETLPAIVLTAEQERKVRIR